MLKAAHTLYVHGTLCQKQSKRAIVWETPYKHGVHWRGAVNFKLSLILSTVPAKHYQNESTIIDRCGEQHIAGYTESLVCTKLFTNNKSLVLLY